MEEVEPIQLLKTGRVIVQLEDGPLTLRIPRAREQAEFMDAIQEAQIEAAEIAARLRGIVTTLVPEDAATVTESDADAAAADARESLRRIQGPGSSTAKAVHRMLTVLGDRPVPAVEDLPMWIVNPQFMPRILQHWSNAPLDYLPARAMTG